MKILSKFYVGIIYAFLYLPIAVLIVFSFNDAKSRTVFTEFTFKWYEKLFTNDIILGAFANTLFVALVAIVCYVAICLGFNAIARTSQLLFPLMFLSVLTLLVFPATQVPISQLLPIGEAGVENIAQSAFSRSFWFGDYVVVYFLMEHVQPKNNKLFAEQNRKCCL